MVSMAMFFAETASSLAFCAFDFAVSARSLYDSELLSAAAAASAAALAFDSEVEALVEYDNA